MQLSDKDLEIIARASRDETIWRYMRFFELAFWGGILCIGFWLVEQPEYRDSELLRRISTGMCVMGAVFFMAVIQKWNNKERQLLLRITSRNSQASD